MGSGSQTAEAEQNLLTISEITRAKGSPPVSDNIFSHKRGPITGMSSKVPKVSVIGRSAGNRSGFEKLPESDPAGAVSLSAAQSAARKSRRHKNIIAIKIGLVILSLSAILAGLAAFFLSRGSSNTNITHFRASRAMSVDISDTATMRSLASATEVFSMAASGAGGDTRTEMMTGLRHPDMETARSGR